MSGAKLKHSANIPLSRIFIAAIAAFLFSVVITWWCCKPRIRQIATYGTPMPWDAIILRTNSDHHVKLGEMVTEWEKNPALVRELLPVSAFHILAIKPDKNSDSWNKVEEILSSLQTSYPSLFTQIEKTKTELTKRLADTQTSHHPDEVVVATTDEPTTPEAKERLALLVAAVKRSFKDVKVSPKVGSYAQIISGLADGSVDFAMCSPLATVIANEALGKNIEVRGECQKAYDTDGYKVVLIQHDDDLHLPDNFSQMHFIFASNISTSGYLVPLRMLFGLGVKIDQIGTDNKRIINPDADEYGDHDTVIDVVAERRGELAGVPSDKLEPHYRSVFRSTFNGAVLGSVLGTVLCICLWFLFPRAREQQ